MVQSVVGVFAVATTVILLWALFAPRGLWSALAAWSTADPRAAEPGFTSYLFRRLFAMLGLLGLLGLGTVVVVNWILYPPKVAPPPTAVEQMWGTPPMVVDRVINCTGPETVSVRWLATRFAALLGVPAQLTGAEAGTALLSDTTQANRLLGYPVVPLGAMIEWVADWVRNEGPSYNKPTKFEVRDGAF